MRSSSKNVDRLSSLPEELHSHILSLMPTKFAVQTCILSKRWRHTWTLIHSLDFDDNTVYRIDQLSKFVDKVFELYKTSQVNKFRMHYCRWGVEGEIVSKWISKAVALNVCELDIRVFNTNLRSMYQCKTLTILRVHFSYRDYAFYGIPSSVNLPCLKTLEIVVGYQGHGNVFNFIYGCPILENLSLEIKCCSKKEDYNIKIPTLKRLNLKLSPYKLKSTNTFCLNVPNLEYLSVDGFLCSFFEMEDLSSLVEVRILCDQYDHHLWAALLKGVSRAKYLSLTINYRWLNDYPPLPKFANLKRLELKGYNGLGWLPQFLESCSELEHLCIEKDVIDCWKEPRSIPTCVLMNLRTLKYKEQRCYQFNMNFLIFMLGNSEVLKMLTVKCDTNLSLKEKECIIIIPRASSDCEIHFDES